MSNSLGFLDQLSGKINLPVDMIKTVLLMLLSIPLSYGFRLIDKPIFRYSYSLAIGLFYTFFLLHQWGFFVLLVPITPLVLFKIVKKHQYFIAFVTSTMFLLFIHVYRYMYDYSSWKVDCSVSVMYIVTKVIYFGSYVQQHKHSPSVFHYLSYCFFFPSVLVGPSFSFKLFENFIQKKNGYQNPQLKSNLLLKQVAKAIIMSGLTAFFIPRFHQYWILQNKWWTSLSPLTQYLLLSFIGFTYRSKFYTAWGITQISIDLSGISWNNKLQNYSSVRCGSLRFETQINPRNKTNYWNISIQIWLKQMVFDKILKYSKSNTLATFATFLYSAFWHGVYLTYYCGFIQWAIVIIISKWGYKMSTTYPIFGNSIIAKILAFIVGSTLLNYIGMFIVVLNWNEAVQAYKNMHFIGNILMAFLLILSFVIKPKSSRHKGEMKSSKKSVHNQKEEAHKQDQPKEVDVKKIQ